MKIENTAALRFILQDDIYLLPDDKIYADKTPVEPVTETPEVKLNYLGGYKKGFLVVVHYPGHQFIDDGHLTALENILKRKEYTIDDVAIVNIATLTVDAAQVLAHFNPQKLLVLGKNAMPQNMQQLPLNELQQLENYTVLYSFSFDEMMDNNAHKKVFWDEMKNL
jgi:hypothetical protein